MTKRRSVVAGWDPTFVNPNATTGRPKGVQTVSDMRVSTTIDIVGEGIFAQKGIPTITGGPTNTVTITPFMAAIISSAGGYYTPSVSANETLAITMANVGAVKIYIQQQDYETNNANVDSAVVLGVVYGATAIPAGSLLLWTTTISSQTSTSGLTFTPAFKYTGAASGFTRVPTYADLANVSVIATGVRALVTSGAQAGEYFYGTDAAWHVTTFANTKLDAALAAYFNASGVMLPTVVKSSNIDFATGIWWKEIGRSTLSVAGNVLAVSGGTFPKYLRVIIINQASGGTINSFLRFNSDSGANYSDRRIEDFVNNTEQSVTMILMPGQTTTDDNYIVVDIVNVLNREKQVMMNGARFPVGAANIPRGTVVGWGKWANTISLINRIDVINTGAGLYAAGSEIIVLGHD
jgi:hypothetical protein